MRRLFARGCHERRATVAAIIVPLAIAAVDGGHLSALPAAPGPRGASTYAQAAIERQPVCIGSAVASAGALSDVLYYRAIAGQDGHVVVGYFAFFAEERPWGNNWLTWTVLPALLVNLVYSRAFLVGPGVQRALYGAGDVEGVEVDYGLLPDGSLRLDHALADDGMHRPVQLSRRDAFALDPGRPTFYSDVWSHQLGGRGARSPSELDYFRCYCGDAIRPLSDSVARAFRVEQRADPAHVEREEGLRLDVTGSGDAPSARGSRLRSEEALSGRVPRSG